MDVIMKGRHKTSSGRRLEAVVFDFNDTLSPGNFTSVFEEFNGRLPRPGSEIVELYKKAGLLDQLMRGRLTELEFWQQVGDQAGVDVPLLLEIADRIKHSKTLDMEVHATVRGLSEDGGLRLALLTDNVRETFDFWVEKFGLRELFHCVVNSSANGFMKREVELYEILLGELNTAPTQTLLVDDNPEFLTIAERLGLVTLHFRGAKDLRYALYELGLLRKAISL